MFLIGESLPVAVSYLGTVAGDSLSWHKVIPDQAGGPRQDVAAPGRTHPRGVRLPEEHVHVDRDAAGVAVVTIDNWPLNTLARRVREELLATLDRLATHDTLRALVLTRQGDRAFSAGADLQEEEGLEGEALRAFMQP